MQSNEIVSNREPDNAGGIRNAMSGAIWQGYDRMCSLKENSYVQSGIEKSISTVSYITPTIGKQYYNEASDALTKIYSSPTESITSGKEYIGGKLYDGRDYIGGKLTGGKDIVVNAKDRVGVKVSSGADYVKGKMNSNAEYVQSTRVGQALKTGVDKGLTAADGVIDYLLPGEEEGNIASREEGVWEHGREVTSKAKDRLTSLVANRYYQTGDYINNKYVKGKENIDMVKGYAYEVTVAKGNSIGERFKHGRELLDSLTMVQRLSKNFGEAVLSAEDLVDKLLPQTVVDSDENDEIERGSLAHAVKLTRRIQRELLGRLRAATTKLPSLHPTEDTSILNKSFSTVGLLPIPTVIKSYFPKYFEENEELKVEDKSTK
ncbi:hypothetical protein LOD99_16107 [Oopsacas minuta]|uniref:Uncharacterized protein n=1 Tax=Oopsacas minuta TaxID=111878 RepID=A0AAV7K6N3_9METZ|nr:hypothetical protein LOD99_16107 [Oopsacas minuta]